MNVADGADQSFTITPNSGYEIANVLVDGLSVGAVLKYTFHDVVSDHTISASFTKADVPPPPEDGVVLFEDGFESGSFSAWSGVTGSPAVQTAVKV